MKRMKKYYIYISLFLFVILFSNCEEESIGQFPIDSISPQPVANVQVENLPGSVKLTYNLPEEEDLLYVKAIYPLSGGVEGESKTSVFSNTMLIKGFGKSQKHTIQLISVDRSRNESEPVFVEIEPLDAPIYEMLENLIIETAFGGFKLHWENPLKEDIVVSVLEKNDSTGEFNYLENFYSSEAIAANAVRGLDSVNATFGVFIRDIFDNYTDTLVVSVKPFFEQEIPKSDYKGLPFSSWFRQHPYGGGMDYMWDDIINIKGNQFYIFDGNEIMPFFTIDLGTKAKLSRFRLWQRVDYLFALHNPKLFEWYGTNDVAVANDSETLGWEENPAWIKLDSFESKRPSGGQEGDDLTAEDETYALAGEEFEFPIDAPEVRFLRFRLIKTWSGSTGVHIGELKFWGQIEN
ncbi:DUF4959 domain-containing protein [Mariniphaga sediminis]|uniref:DUF4959 domain-containing protein n=2 Tax=Mariniphaga sediminis TaxID=1628158 RepID=A0A399DAV6_9BACT|nr:DUF4959 domain-containing protein [Mariniphaga sediminis]